MRSGSAEVVVSIFCFIVYGVFGEGLAPKSLQRYNIFMNYAREGAIFLPKLLHISKKSCIFAASFESSLNLQTCGNPHNREI